MVKFIADKFHGFSQRPFYEASELDGEFERIVSKFLMEKYGKVEFPFKTDDITMLIEREVADLDQYADLMKYGETVEGATEFNRRGKPNVLISQKVHRVENRLRTTLTHEFGHVKLHSFLFAQETPKRKMGPNQSANGIYCKQDTIVSARKVDWMEWQASYASGVALMPKTYVHKVVRPFREESRRPADQVSDNGRAMIQAVINAFEVSREAASVRLKVLNLLDSRPIQRSLFA